ncbi:MAG: cysteine dioxygenase family protein [Crocinitomicaceae bacterium]
MKRTALPVSIETFIKNIKSSFEKSPEIISKLLKDADIKESELNQWTNFDHPKNEGYGRSLIYKDSQFEIMVMSWAPNDATAIHNHGYTNWGAVQVFGTLEHTVFEKQENFLVTSYREKLNDKEIITVDGDLIHQMANHSDENALSIHVYGTSENAPGITDDALIYDVGEHELLQVSGGAFYDLPASEKTVVSSAIYADRLTEIAHYASLLRHYLKTGYRGPHYRKSVNYFQDRSFESRLITELEMDSKGVLYWVELNKVKILLKKLNESSRIIDSILLDINDFDRYS